MSGYAEKTKVSVAASKAEIEATLNRFGIRDVAYGTMGGLASVMLQHNGRPYTIRLEMPHPEAHEFHHCRANQYGTEKRRDDQAAYAAWEQACRVKWRELALLIKAKLVAISNDAVAFEDEFLAYAMLPDRSTVGEWAAEQLEGIVKAGRMPELLPGVQAALSTGDLKRTGAG